MHALAKEDHSVGRGGLCKMLALLARDGDRVEVVFDGPPPRGSSAKQIAQTGVSVSYSAGRSADEIIIERISDNSAPRRLVVVSTDREIRRAARRRRCRIALSEDFAIRMIRLVEQARAPKLRSVEPKEKRHGLTDKQADYWLREFGLDQ